MTMIHPLKLTDIEMHISTYDIKRYDKGQHKLHISFKYLIFLTLYPFDKHFS